MFPYTHPCMPTLNEFTGKMDDLGKKDGGFHTQNVRQRASEVLKGKYTTKALGTYISSLGGVASA